MFVNKTRKLCITRNQVCVCVVGKLLGPRSQEVYPFGEAWGYSHIKKKTGIPPKKGLRLKNLHKGEGIWKNESSRFFVDPNDICFRSFPYKHGRREWFKNLILQRPLKFIVTGRRIQKNVYSSYPPVVTTIKSNGFPSLPHFQTKKSVLNFKRPSSLDRTVPRSVLLKLWNTCM